MKTLTYLKNNFWNLLFIFFTYSFIGYIWEVSKHFILYHQFVNRGVQHGPILPIYGIAAVITYFFMNKLKKKNISIFFICGFICTVFEYLSSLFLEKVFHLRWWSYFKYPLNINGRVCLYSFLFFALLGYLSIKFIIPYLNNLLKRILNKPFKILLIILSVVFIFDLIYSSFNPNTGKSISYNINCKV